MDEQKKAEEEKRRQEEMEESSESENDNVSTIIIPQNTPTTDENFAWWSKLFIAEQSKLDVCHYIGIVTIIWICIGVVI